MRKSSFVEDHANELFLLLSRVLLSLATVAVIKIANEKIMVDYRRARPDEREDYIDLANHVFGTDFESLMPKVYAEGVDSSSMHRVAVDERGRLRALVAVLPQMLTVANRTLSTGFVGTVSVHPRDRGQGHMKALMNLWLDEMRATHDLAVLSGQRQRYEYFGFTPGGVELKYTVGKANLRHALRQVDETGLSFCPLFEVDGAAAFAQRIHTAQLAYVHRDVAHLPAIFKTFHENAVGVVEADKLIGYLITNKAGHDISEFAVERVEDVPRIIKAYMAHLSVERISIHAPEYDGGLNANLGNFAEGYVMEASAMYNIFNFATVLQAYLTLKHRTMGLTAGEFSAVLDGQPVSARVDESGVTVESSVKADAVALTKQQAQTLLLTTHGRYMGVPAPAGWFPLPLFWHKVDTF